MGGELDKRIATALSSDVPAAEVAALIVELVAAVCKSEEAVVAERTAANLAALPGSESVRTAMRADDAAYDQLCGALPKLKARLAELQAAEYAKAWEKDYKRIKVQVEEAARKLTEYPKLVAKLIDI